MTAPLRSLAVLVTAALIACGASGRAQRSPAAVAPPPSAPPPAKVEWFTAGEQSTNASEQPSGLTQVAPKSVDAKPARPNRDSPLGVNLDSMRPGNRDRVFTDLVRLSTPWVSMSKKKWDDGRPLSLDDNGWILSLLPNQFAGTQMKTVKGGRFVATYEGLGILEFRGRGVKVESQQRGRIAFSAPAGATITVVLTAMNPFEPLRALRIVPAELAGDKPPRFHPDFIKALRKFSVLRFNGWTRSVTNPAKAWSERAQPEDRRQTSAEGVAYEYMVELANEVGTDLWLTVPVRADDDHIRLLAGLLQANLQPELKVYVEFGHRMMAPGTKGFEYAATKGRSLVGESAPKEAAAARYYARRSRFVFDAFSEVLGAARTVRVVAGQSDDAKRLQALLELDDLRANADVLAIDALLGGAMKTAEWRTQIRRHDVQWLLDQLEQQSLPALLGRVSNARSLAERFGLRLVAHSAGLALRTASSARDEAVEALFVQANRHPRVEKLYAALLDGWRTQGGGLLTHAALATRYGRRGSLGAVESVHKLDTPKFRALMSFAERSPRWWSDQPASTIVAQAKGPAGPELPMPSAAPADPLAPPAESVSTRASTTGHTGVWITGATGVAALAAAAGFATLYLEAASDRDQVLAEDPTPTSGARARGLDDDAFTWSVLAGTSLGIAGGALTTAGVLSLSESGSRARKERAANPWPWLTAATAVVAGTAGGIYLARHLDAVDQRDGQLGQADPGTGRSATIRALDDEAFGWSVLSGVAFSAAALSLAASLYMFIVDSQTVDYDMDVDAVFSSGRVLISPSGVQVRW